MNFKEPETYEERRLRLGLVPKETKHSIWIALILFVLMVLILLGSKHTSLGYLLSTNGVGNPYECKTCKDLGFACKEHKDVTDESLLHDKVEQYIVAYSGNTDIEGSKQYMYGGNEYNTSCDFCNEQKEECYSCKYTREAIYNVVTDLEQEAGIYSLFCDECSKAGYPKCYHDKMQMISLVLDRLK